MCKGNLRGNSIGTADDDEDGRRHTLNLSILLTLLRTGSQFHTPGGPQLTGVSFLTTLQPTTRMPSSHTKVVT